MADTGLTDGDFTESVEPYALFGRWLEDATAAEPNDPNALALATVDADGMPNVRMVLLKGFDEDGFVFYTNYESTKGREVLGAMKAAMCFHWKSLRRQVRVRGPVEKVSDAEADAYFASRPRGSRGRWKAASRWKRRWPNTPPATPSATSPARPTGRDSGSGRSRSNSGTTAPFACTTG
jgi:pyridoxamine 5'-phosphate oxidase